MIVGLRCIVKCTAAVECAYDDRSTHCMTAVIHVMCRSLYSEPCCLKL